MAKTFDNSWFKEKAFFRARHMAIMRDSVVVGGRMVPRCQKTGILLMGTKPAMNSAIVVHIMPPRGDRDLFFNFDNLMTVSRVWHLNQKQALADQATAERQSRNRLFEPDDLKASRPPLTIISGPPAAGKSTFLAANAGPDDAVVDMDLEADRLGIDRHTADRSDLMRLLSARNERLRELAESDAPKAWWTATLPRAETRANFARQLIPERVIVILTPAAECLRRIAEHRPGAGGDLRDAVGRWYDEYSPRTGELII